MQPVFSLRRSRRSPVLSHRFELNQARACISFFLAKIFSLETRQSSYQKRKTSAFSSSFHGNRGPFSVQPTLVLAISIIQLLRRRTLPIYSSILTVISR